MTAPRRESRHRLACTLGISEARKLEAAITEHSTWRERRQLLEWAATLTAYGMRPAQVDPFVWKLHTSVVKGAAAEVLVGVVAQIVSTGRVDMFDSNRYYECTGRSFVDVWADHRDMERGYVVHAIRHGDVSADGAVQAIIADLVTRLAA